MHALLGLDDLATLLVGQTAHHVGILGPGARHTLIEQNLVANARSLLRAEELGIGLTHHVALRAQTLCHGQRRDEESHKQQHQKHLLGFGKIE